MIKPILNNDINPKTTFLGKAFSTHTPKELPRYYGYFMEKSPLAKDYKAPKLNIFDKIIKLIRNIIV